MNIFFYSNKSDSCKAFISLMQGENLLRFFNPICVDGNKDIPAGIRVPAIMIKGMPRAFMNEEAFAWFSRIKQWRINTQMQKMTQDQQKYLKNINQNLVSEDNTLGFCPGEMEGLSDMFSYLQEGDIAVPHTYYNCDQLGQGDICVKRIKDDKMSIDKTSKITKEMESERKKQDELFKVNIENFRKQYTK